MLLLHAQGGTEDVLRRFLASFGSSPAAMLGAFEPLRLAPSIRHTALTSLQAAVKVPGGACHAVLLCPVSSLQPGEPIGGLAPRHASAVCKRLYLLGQP